LVLADNWRRVDFKVSLSLIPSDSSSHDSERIPLHFPLAALTPDFRGFRRRRHQSKSTTVPLVLADNWRRVDFKVSLSLIPGDSSSHDSERIPLHFPLAAHRHQIFVDFGGHAINALQQVYSRRPGSPGAWSPSVIGRNALVATGIQRFLR